MQDYLNGRSGSTIKGNKLQVPKAAAEPKNSMSMASFDLPTLSMELRMHRDELIREFRKIGMQVQTACTEEIRTNTQSLLKDLQQELQSQQQTKSLQAESFLQTSPLQGFMSSGGVARKMRKPAKSEPPGLSQLSARWMPEAVEKASKDQLRDAAESSGEEMARDMARTENFNSASRMAWTKISGETNHNLWKLPPADAQADPPQLPHEVPLPPPDPPQVDMECNGDAAAGRPGGAPQPGEGGLLGMPGASGTDARKARGVSFDVDSEEPAGDEQEVSNKSDSSCEDEGVLRKAIMSKQATRKLSLGLQTARRSRLLKEKKKPPLCSMSATDILKSSRFDNLIGFVIFVNAITIGIQADYASRHLTEDFPMAYMWMERGFCVIFIAELALRLYVNRCLFFTRREVNVLWNYFDFFVVAAQVTEEALMLAAESSGLDLSSFRLLRVLRVLRLVRIFRVIRVLHLISELRTIISSIMGSFRSLGWTVVLLFLMIYIVGVYFTQSITDHMVEKYSPGQTMSQPDQELRYYFGDLFRAILSLWQAMSGGADWDAMAGPLVKIDVSMGIAFAAYIAFALLALMNVVTGVFVQTALQNAKDEEDAFLTDQIIKLFEKYDRVRSQTITLEEINSRLCDPDIQGEWKAISVSPEEARYLFELLDIDQKGEIAFEEFLSGCLRLHGTSKSMDLLTVMQECRTEFRLWHDHLKKWDRFQDVHRQLAVSLAGQIHVNNHLLQEFMESQDGSLQTAMLHKESVQRLEQKLRPVEKSFEVVKRMLRAPGGFETVVEVMSANAGNSEGRTGDDPAWLMRSKFDEV